MTQREFDGLPLLLKPADMKDITGLDRNGLRALREEHPEIVARQCGRGQYQYSKLNVAKLLKLT